MESKVVVGVSVGCMRLNIGEGEGCSGEMCVFACACACACVRVCVCVRACVSIFISTPIFPFYVPSFLRCVGVVPNQKNRQIDTSLMRQGGSTHTHTNTHTNVQMYTHNYAHRNRGSRINCFEQMERRRIES